MERFFVGTSGWAYPHWRGLFYPDRLPTARWLSFYANRFGAVEVNNTFYQLPTVRTVEHWRSEVPRAFQFAVKASRLLTHARPLADSREPLARFLERAVVLGEQLGPILFQLPPNFPRDDARLAAFLRGLPENRRYAFEFRHPSWHVPEVLHLLHCHQCAYCIADAPQLRKLLVVTAPFIYARFHTPGPEHGHRYTDDQLSRWADRIGELAEAHRAAYLFFNNDVGGHAVANAARLRELLAARFGETLEAPWV